MKDIHIECNPDETLASKMGFRKKFITHHHGKSRVFKALSKNRDQLAIVDEDPLSSKTTYEKALIYVSESDGMRLYRDNSGNKVVVLKGKLEEWIVDVCRQSRLTLDQFRLPPRPNDLHSIINHRLKNWNRLLDRLVEKRNPALLTLKGFLV